MGFTIRDCIPCRPKPPTQQFVSERRVASVVPPTPSSRVAALNILAARLPSIVAKAGHGELWHVKLRDLGHIPTSIVLHKFLNANRNDPNKAEEHMINALTWRKENRPLSVMENQSFDRRRFGQMGYVTMHNGDDGKHSVIIWIKAGTAAGTRLRRMALDYPEEYDACSRLVLLPKTAARSAYDYRISTGTFTGVSPSPSWPCAGRLSTAPRSRSASTSRTLTKS
jgi:hypothetical protein